MKRIIAVLLPVLMYSCSTEYYVKPIDNWMQLNLNDYSSYEPIEYIVLDSTNAGKIFYDAIKIMHVETAMQRAIDLIKNISDELRNEKINAKVKDLSLDDLSLKNLDDVYYSVLVLGNTCAAKTGNLELESQLEGALNRVKSEYNHIEENLSKVGLQPDNFTEKFENGLLIHHRFRGANSFGGTVINDMIFVLSNDKTNVESAINLDQS